jgi:hypothetical protein
MISAFCHNASSQSLITTENGAKCGPDLKSNPVEVVIVCAKM